MKKLLLFLLLLMFIAPAAFAQIIPNELIVKGRLGTYVVDATIMQQHYKSLSLLPEPSVPSFSVAVTAPAGRIDYIISNEVIYDTEPFEIEVLETETNRIMEIYFKQ